jgi:hypothetical protein
MRWWRVPVPPRPRRSCKDQLHPCARPVMVSRFSAALTSSAFQTDAFTGLAFWTSSCAERNFVIWRGPAESNRACAQAQALQARSVTRLGVTLNVLKACRWADAAGAIFGHQPWPPRWESSLHRRPSERPAGPVELRKYYRRPKPAAHFSSSTSQYRKSRHVSCKKFGGKCLCAAIS